MRLIETVRFPTSAMPRPRVPTHLIPAFLSLAAVTKSLNFDSIIAQQLQWVIETGAFLKAQRSELARS
jgi:hypothetical protein